MEKDTGGTGEFFKGWPGLPQSEDNGLESPENALHQKKKKKGKVIFSTEKNVLYRKKLLKRT